MFVRKRPTTELKPPSPTTELSAEVAPISTYRNATTGLEALKQAVHARLLDEADAQLFRGDTLSPEAIEYLKRLTSETAQQREELLTRSRLEQLQSELIDEISGLGPIEPLMKDPGISEIMVNARDSVWVELNGRLMRTDIRFETDAHLLRVIDRIVTRVGRHIDEASPMCDARLADGSRVNAVIPPLALNGPCLTIRRFRRDALTIDALIEREALAPEMALFLRRAVEAKLNVLVSGGTGTGKTTMLNVLSGFIPHGERLVTIEDAAELQMQQPHVVRLETRQPNAEGHGAVLQADLLRNALRMRPDRIIIGEVRGAEAFSMLQAMNTGHEGSLTTIHANTCRDALSRLETMVLMAGHELPHRAIREQVAAALDLVVQIERGPDGRRRVVSVTELIGLEGDTYLLQDLFRFHSEGRGAEGEIIGRHRPSGIVPRCLERMARIGVTVPLSCFQEAHA